MKLEELIKAVDARILQRGSRGAPEITHVFASNKMSELLEQAGPQTMLLTSLVNPQLACLADLTDCPALCLVDGVNPEPKLLEEAALSGTTLVLCRLDMRETYSRLIRRLCGKEFSRS